MKVVGNLEVRIGVLNGRVDKQARQLSKKSHKIMTVQSLRQFAINTLLGMPGIQYGAKPAPIPADANLTDIEEVGRDWLEKYLGEFAAEVIDRENTLAGAAPVIAAIGAIGNSIVKAGDEYEREHVARDLLDSLKQVNWNKGDHWAGIAGKFTEKGTFSIGGTKEVAYAIYNVLTDPTNPGYRRIRTGTPVTAPPETPVAAHA